MSHIDIGARRAEHGAALRPVVAFAVVCVRAATVAATFSGTVLNK